MSPAVAPHGARPVASFKNPWAWCVVAAGLVVYAVLADILVDRWVRLEALIPWVVTLLLPPVFYAVLLALFFKSLPWKRWAVATIGLWAVHLLLGMTIVAFVALLDGHYAKSLSAPFPPPPVPQILWVPLLLLPLRDFVAAREAPRRAARAARPRAAVVPATAAPVPRPTSEAPAPALAPPVMAPAPPVPPPTAAPAVPAPAAGRPSARAERPSVHPPERPTSVLVRPTAGSAQPAAPAVPSPAQRVLDQMLAEDPAVPSVRIPFERVAAQFPAEVFRATHAEVAASLREPGMLLVPQRLALAQLEEGVVQIAWEVVSSQFPRDLLAVGDEGIRRRLPDGQLVLPLDEVVQQMPAELFTAAPIPAEPEGLEGIPDIFRVELANPASAPALAPPRPMPVASTAASAGLVVSPAPAPVPPPPPLESAPVPPPPPAPVAPPPVPLRPAPGPVPTVRSAPQPAPQPLPAVPPAAADVGEAGPRRVEVPAREALAAVPAGVGPLEDEPIASLRGIAERLSPLVPLDMASTEVDGVRLLTLQSPVVDPYLAVTAAHAFVPLVADPRAPWAIEQITVRGQQAAVILTPLGGPGAAMLVAAVPRCGTLALLELVCRRQARAGRSNAAPDPGGAEGDFDLDAELVEVEPSTRLRRLASALDAVGPVRVSALRDPESQHAVYLFLPDGSDVRGAGGFTAEVARALRRVGQPGTFDTVILRGGRRHMVIRLAGADDTAVVAAAGETRAPGLAHRQVADVAGAVVTS